MIFFGKRKILLTIFIFILMALGGWFWRHRESVPFVSQPLSTAAAPFQYSMSHTATWGKIGIKIIDQSFSNWSDLERLKRENESLKAEQSRYSGILAENIRLRHLLKFREGYTQFNLLGASVIGRDYGTWTNTMVIDCGVNQGLKKYMPVIVPEGLVGFVSEVYTESARVQLLIDPRTMVGGIIQRPASRVASMVSGNTGKLGVLSFVNIVKEDDVIPKLKAKGFKNVTLMPIMMVAGDHANNDMAGDDPDSHKSILTKAGFKVNTYIHGLGENENVRALYIQRADEALAAFKK